MVSIYYICHRERDRYTGSYNIFSCCGLFVLPTVQRPPPTISKVAEYLTVLMCYH